MGLTRVRTRLVTSHAIEAYGGVQLSEEVVTQVAKAVASGEIPMHFQHDISRPIEVSNVEAGTERLPDGHLAAWADFDVDEVVWAEFQQELAETSAPGGMSISMTAPLTGESLASDSRVVVAADAHHFTEEQIREARAILARVDESSGGEVLYQFSFVPEAKVVFDIVLEAVYGLGLNLTASAIYDAARGFLAGGRDRIIFNITFRETRRGTRKLQIHIEASTEDELRAAISGLPSIIDSGAAGTFSSHQGGALQALKHASRPPTASDSNEL